MARVSWGVGSGRRYDQGLDRGIVYIPGYTGVPWPGLVGVNQSPKTFETKTHYLDGIKYANYSSHEEFAATIDAFGAPWQFDGCLGLRQVKSGLFLTDERPDTFDLSYRTKVRTPAGRETYKLHLVYNAQVNPSARSHTTKGSSIAPSRLSLPITTINVDVQGYRPTAYLTLDEVKAEPESLATVLDILYGTEEEDARMPTLKEMVDLFETFAMRRA